MAIFCGRSRPTRSLFSFRRHAPRIRQIRSLSWQEWRWLLAALVLLPAAGLSLRWIGLQATMDWLERCLGGHRQTPLLALSAADPAAIARTVRIAAVYGPYHATCLPRALVVWGLLRRCALEGALTIGVRKAEGELEAHAWVELDGVSLEQGPETVPFAPLRASSGMSGQGTTL